LCRWTSLCVAVREYSDRHEGQRATIGERIWRTVCRKSLLTVRFVFHGELIQEIAACYIEMFLSRRDETIQLGRPPSYVSGFALSLEVRAHEIGDGCTISLLLHCSSLQHILSGQSVVSFLALSRRPKADVRRDLVRVYGLEKYKDFWQAEPKI
jgi:hypothetical protein